MKLLKYTLEKISVLWDINLNGEICNIDLISSKAARVTETFNRKCKAKESECGVAYIS